MSLRKVLYLNLDVGESRLRSVLWSTGADFLGTGVREPMGYYGTVGKSSRTTLPSGSAGLGDW
jgi:hypothetical protein